MPAQINLNLYGPEKREWLREARACAKYLAQRNGQVSADDVWERCPIPEGMDPRIMGAVSLI